MGKFAVFSGFLGSGKTTTMMALTDYYTAHYARSAMISNDVGHGVELADHRFAALSGCNASAMTETCICYQNENLADRLNFCYEDGCELVISDIPGFGVGALEHVYHGLTEKFPGQYELAPFTVLVEPAIVEEMRSRTNPEMEYLHDTQLVEADLIVLNKCDQISGEQKEKDLKWLSEKYPLADVIAISARTGDGLDALSLALKNGAASMRRPDIGYGGEAFCASMGKISEYYLQYYAAICCHHFDGTAYLTDLAEKIRKEICSRGFAIPHCKLLAWEPEGDFGKADLLGNDRPLEIPHRFSKPCTDIAVIINASAVCPAEQLEQILTGAAQVVSEQYNLTMTVFKKECFGMGG